MELCQYSLMDLTISSLAFLVVAAPLMVWKAKDSPKAALSYARDQASIEPGPTSIAFQPPPHSGIQCVLA